MASFCGRELIVGAVKFPKADERTTIGGEPRTRLQ